jgi:hypothetical protein
MARGAGPTRA